MGLLKNISILLLLLPLKAIAQNSDDMVYRRSSLYQLMIGHLNQEYSAQIKTAFLNLPISDHYNDHNLSVRVVEMPEKLKNAGKDFENNSITAFLERNLIASRLVAKWFNRDINNGVCDMSLVKSRGLYNASEFDRQLAMQSARGKALLEDAGEDLISNTFVVVNDIRYYNKNQGAKIAAGIIGGLIAIAGKGSESAQKNAESTANLISSLKGFAVKINSFLYQLVWDDDTANKFYATQYEVAPDEAKYKAFEDGRSAYKLKYIGKVKSSGSTTSFLGISEKRPDLMFAKALQRAIDENIVDLQQEFEVFRVKSPLISTEPLKAYIGMKEGVTEKSRYEVLEAYEGEDGKCKYKRVGIIAPEPNMIWDNRYMADLEKTNNSGLNATTFKKISGKGFVNGMLIREIAKAK